MAEPEYVSEPLATPGSQSRDPLPESEMARSTRGKNVMQFQKAGSPDSTPEASELRRDIAATATLSVREKSSIQFRDCIVSEEPAPELNSEGRFATRSAMLAARRQQSREENAAIGSNPTLSLPVGSVPGAPGKNPEMKRFTHFDVERMMLPR